MIKNNKKREAPKTDQDPKKKSPKLEGKPTSSPKFSKSTSAKPGSKGKPHNKFDKNAKGGQNFKNKNANFQNKFKGKPGAGPAGGGEPEKTDWRKFKQDKKDLKLKRKQSKDSYQLTIEAKQLYEKLKW